MSNLNITWERVVGENGTMYCAWLWNIYNCEEQEMFQRLALTSGIFNAINSIFIGIIVAYIRFGKKITNRSLFFKTVMFFDIFLVFLWIHSFFLYTNAYHNSPYGLLIVGAAVAFGVMSFLNYGIMILETIAEMSSYNHKFEKKHKIPIYSFLVFSYLFAIILGLVLCHLLSINSPVAEKLLESLVFLIALFLGLCGLLYSIVAAIFLKKILKVYNGLTKAGKTQVLMSVVVCISFVLAVGLHILVLSVIAFYKDIFKNIPVSKAWFNLVFFSFSTAGWSVGLYFAIAEICKESKTPRVSLNVSVAQATTTTTEQNIYD